MSDSPKQADAVGYVISRLELVTDARERVRAILAVRQELRDEAARHQTRFDELLGLTLLELREADPPATFAELGILINLAPQRAHQLVEAAKATITNTKGK